MHDQRVVRDVLTLVRLLNHIYIYKKKKKKNNVSAKTNYLQCLIFLHRYFIHHNYPFFTKKKASLILYTILYPRLTSIGQLIKYIKYTTRNVSKSLRILCV